MCIAASPWLFQGEGLCSLGPYGPYARRESLGASFVKYERAADKVADTSRGTRLLSETTGRRQFRVQLSRPSQMSTTARNETKRVKRELRLLRVLRLRLLRQYRLGLSLPLRHQQLCCCLLVCRLGCGLLLRLWMSCGVSPRR